MGRLCYVLILASSFLACEENSIADKTVATFRCSASDVIQQINPVSQVAFINKAETRDTDAMARWRATLGPPVFDRAGRLCEDSPIDSLLVVSWNVHVAHGDVRRFISDLRHGDVIPGYKAQHFVLLLQEAYREGDAVPEITKSNICPSRIGGSEFDIEDLSDSLGLAVYYVPSMRNGCERGRARQDRGNAIVSTLPLSNLRAVELPLVRQRRVAAIADIEGRTTNGSTWKLALVSVHFENRGPGRPGDWVHGRAKQAEALMAALPESDLAVIGGDFNTMRGATEPAVKIVSARIANMQEHQDKTTYVTYAVVRSQLDYLFFKGAGAKQSKYWRARSRYDSDHYPIMGFLRLAP
jgi:endonuclease/exonuclease/phosphatase family metal-dependent hydrolase